MRNSYRIDVRVQNEETQTVKKVPAKRVDIESVKLVKESRLM